MPFNITANNKAKFTVEFLDVNGVLTVPSSATLSISYVPTSGSTALTTTTIDMTPTGRFFTATWDTAGVSQGLWNYSVSAPGELVSPSGTGQIRIIG